MDGKGAGLTSAKAETEGRALGRRPDRIECRVRFELAGSPQEIHVPLAPTPRPARDARGARAAYMSMCNAPTTRVIRCDLVCASDRA